MTNKLGDLCLTLAFCIGNNKMCFVYVVFELNVTVSYIEILSVTQQCFHRKFISPKKKQCKLRVPVFERNFIPTNLH